MKKIINNKRYDTETARLVGEWDNGLSGRDFARCDEDLYQKKTGEYFLHGEGGGNSKYGEWHGNSGGPGETIILMTAEEAREWAEKRLTAEEYEAEFAVDDEPEPANTVGLKIRRLREMAGISQKELADKSGIDQRQLSRYENGQDMQVSILLKIATALGADPGELLK